MKLNQKVNKKHVYITAKTGKKFKVDSKDKKVTFIIPNKQLDFDMFRQISVGLMKFSEKNIDFDISSFLKVLKFKCKFSLAIALLARIDAFNEPSFTLKSKKEKFEANIIFNKSDIKEVMGALDVLNGIHLARQFQVKPANYLGINDFVKDAVSLLKSLKNKHLKIKVLDIKDIKKEKMGLLQAVNAGSDEPAQMLVVEYKNAPKKNLLAYVGKGIMFDAGGYELKPSQYMAGMNQDMTGAAAVFGTIYSLAKTKAKVNVVGFMPLAKNLINEKSMLVSDVYKACNGRSVEIVAPDAEGRLILADAIAYANKKYKISKIFTVATLTGLSSISYGDFMTPCWTTKHDTAKAIKEASKVSLEHVLCMPFYSEYASMVNKSSSIADCANSTKGEREASNATAGMFLRLFSKCDDFAHFDIAGTNEFKKHPVTPLISTLFLFAVNYFGNK